MRVSVCPFCCLYGQSRWIFFVVAWCHAWLCIQYIWIPTNSLTFPSTRLYCECTRPCQHFLEPKINAKQIHFSAENHTRSHIIPNHCSRRGELSASDNVSLPHAPSGKNSFMTLPYITSYYAIDHCAHSKIILFVSKLKDE